MIYLLYYLTFGVELSLFSLFVRVSLHPCLTSNFYQVTLPSLKDSLRCLLLVPPRLSQRKVSYWTWKGCPCDRLHKLMGLFPKYQDGVTNHFVIVIHWSFESSVVLLLHIYESLFLSTYSFTISIMSNESRLVLTLSVYYTYVP